MTDKELAFEATVRALVDARRADQPPDVRDFLTHLITTYPAFRAEWLRHEGLTLGDGE